MTPRVAAFRRVRSIAGLVALFIAAVPASAAAGAWVLAPGDWSSEVRGSFFSADTYWDGAGERVRLADGGVREERSLSAWNEFGWKNNMSVHVAIPFQSVTRRHDDTPFQRTETGFGDLALGARYAFTNDPTAFSLEATWVTPMGYWSEASPALGPAQQNLVGLARVGMALGARAFVDLAGGYAHRMDAPADQAIAEAAGGVWFGNSLLVGGQYRGALAVGDGETPADEITEHRVGPIVVYRVDDHIDLAVGSMHTASGENVLHADRFFVSLTVKQSSLNRLQGFLGNAQRP